MFLETLMIIMVFLLYLVTFMRSDLKNSVTNTSYFISMIPLHTYDIHSSYKIDEAIVPMFPLMIASYIIDKLIIEQQSQFYLQRNEYAIIEHAVVRHTNQCKQADNGKDY